MCNYTKAHQFVWESDLFVYFNPAFQCLLKVVKSFFCHCANRVNRYLFDYKYYHFPWNKISNFSSICFFCRRDTNSNFFSICFFAIIRSNLQGYISDLIVIRIINCFSCYLVISFTLIRRLYFVFLSFRSL